MGRLYTPEERAYMDGEASYPNKCIGYPTDSGPIEDAWLAGWNKAKYASDYALEDAVGEGIDTFLWGYRAAYA